MPSEIRLSEVLASLSYVLDLTEGQPEGHAIRNCYVGMQLAEHLALAPAQRSALFYALLLKDLGCSSNSAKTTYLFAADDHMVKRRLKTVDWPKLLHSAGYVIRSAGEGKSLFQRFWHIFRLGIRGQRGARELIRIRCERGADIARQLGFPEETALAIRALDEHWNGKGHPRGLRGEAIPLLGRVLCFAQTLEVFHNAQGPEGAREVVRRRRGRWFDPHLCELFFDHVAEDEAFWQRLASPELLTSIGEFEPPDRVLHVNAEQLDTIAEAFARVIDAKSPYTYQHSARVAEIVRGLSAELDLPAREQQKLYHAALLHDIGKLGIPNTILDKPGKLSDEEWAAMRQHPAYTYHILEQVSGFSQIAGMASAHHERLDGRGYHRQIGEGELPLAVRLLTVADQYEALTAALPYRQALTPETALGILEEQVGTGVDEKAFAALNAYLEIGS